MTKSLPVSALNLLLFALLAVGLFMLMTEPAMAQGQINLSPITSILTGIATTLTGPLGRAMATLAVIGIGVAWLMGYVDFRTVVYVVAGIAIVAGASVIVNSMWASSARSSTSPCCCRSSRPGPSASARPRPASGPRPRS